ncbi:4-alpha-glucanotransferase [Kushneria marisflavi]|uniref:4-alpha-glucanotransferase n=1 Tax=Kushneria marisflavi TaxID=157779 RepID=A0A240US28_9GAMM|nr:4-alpha-glucanotransferase [Kushneria marisflavi]ART63883.1 4-alpha-glucanotransferase [Kushneria marisflavi]RKD85595.1 4-alpha-glucanotransferase [Kushneria marisflavi]
MNRALISLAEAAGIIIDWQDSQDRPQQLDEATIKGVLAGLGYRCDTSKEISESLAAIKRLQAPESVADWPPLIVGEIEQGIELPGVVDEGVQYTLIDESGRTLEGCVDNLGRLEAVTEPGYYQLQIEGKRRRLAVAPHRCMDVAALAGDGAPSMAGLGVQLYSLRRDNDGGIGDCEALGQLAEHAGKNGLDAMAISPVHALFPHQPERFSPYSPSTRLAFNPLYSASDNGVTEDTAAGNEATLLVDYDHVSRMRWQALEHEFGSLSEAGRQALNAFRRESGETLENHCRFEAISEVLGPMHAWPDDMQDVKSEAVASFSQEHGERVAFYAFAQWQIALELATVQQRAIDAGQRIGLIADIAVGVDPHGSQAWSRPEEMLGKLRIGSPPDDFNANGQEWGVTGFSPQGLIEYGFDGFIATLRACLHGAGGLRIDHIMGLSRLWLIPEGASPTQGAYVRYPEQSLLRLIALESWRHRAVIIGEDLGTVEPAFRERLEQFGILGMGVLWFEREDDEFTAARDYPSRAVAMTSTHDLPTVAGWRLGRDLDWRIKLDMLGEDETSEQQREQRTRDIAALADTFGISPDADRDTWLEAAAHHIGSTPAPLVLLQLEDLLGLEEQPNLPGTLDEHPNWRRRQPLSVDDMFETPEVRSRLRAMTTARAGAGTHE